MPKKYPAIKAARQAADKQLKTLREALSGKRKRRKRLCKSCGGYMGCTGGIACSGAY